MAAMRIRARRPAAKTQSSDVEQTIHMARVRLPALAMIMLTGAAPAMLLAGITPALAQFTDIFTDPQPPRPPGSVPRGQGPQPQYVPPQQPQYVQPRPQYVPPQPQYQQPQYVPPADVGRGPPVQSGVTATQSGNWVNPDLPPAQPLPSPMNLPPSNRPGRGTIQSEDLNAPPGTGAAPSGDLTPITPVTPNAPAGENPAQTPGQPPGTAQPADTAPQPGDEIVVEPPPQRIANPTAVFNGLDKITGRIISFDVAINETVQFGALQVTPRVCYSRPPTETPNTDAFLQVDEVTLTGEIKRIFSGWMFAASPGLNAVEHPTYDVWLTECKGGTSPAVADAADAQGATRKPVPAPPTRPPRPAPQRAPQQQQPAGTLLPPLR